MFFDRIEAAPADPILGLTESFRADPRHGKLNLGVGVYQDGRGVTPVMDCVKQAERILLEQEQTKSYLPIIGLPEYGRFARELIFGLDSELVDGGRAVSCHCPGGTGALRIGADFLHQQHVAATVWISDPTWANHIQIAASAGLKVERYPYYDPQSHALDFARMLETLERARPGDIVLLHASCHNPTGVDPTPDQWEKLARFMAERQLLPFVDFAYQGLGQGLDEDAVGVRILARHHQELLVASSFSKNFSLYSERVGVLTVVAAENKVAARALSQLKVAVRSAISNPPAHGEKIVVTVLTSPELRAQWQRELGAIRARIASMRTLLVEKLSEAGSPGWDFFARQHGMFSFTGLNRAQVDRLREQYGIYAVASGRICVGSSHFMKRV